MYKSYGHVAGYPAIDLPCWDSNTNNSRTKGRHFYCAKLHRVYNNQRLTIFKRLNLNLMRGN